MAIDLGEAANALRESGRDVDGTTLRGNVKVVTTEQVVQLLERAGAGGGGHDEHAMHTLEARLAEAESRAEIAEAEARRRADQINALEGQLASGSGAAAGTDPAEAQDYVDLVEQPDYPGVLAELGEAREDLARLESRLGGGSGEVRELATAIMKALGGDEDEEGAPEGDGAAPIAGVEVLRRRLDVVESDLQRDQEAVSILFDAMLDGNGTVSVVSELIGLTARGVGYAGEVRTMRRVLALIAEIPIAE
ncbi:MAG: hypothetical protein ACYTGX_04830 [Planctomycetota bacterium]|jgi:hypothetical protein